jgi:hypothetical protein
VGSSENGLVLLFSELEENIRKIGRPDDGDMLFPKSNSQVFLSGGGSNNWGNRH